MTNNSTTSFSFDCGYSPKFWEACKLITYITYTIAPPVCLLIGLPSHGIALVAFLKHRSADIGYSYQILTTVSRILEILGMFQFSMFFWHGAGQDWSGEGAGDGPGWYMSNYRLMWFTAHLPPMLVAAVTDIAVYVSAATAADRAFALWKPFAYQAKNHRRHFWIAAILCFLIPLICEFHVVFSFGVLSKNSTKYLVQYVTFFPNSSIKTHWSHIAATIRSIAEAALIVCSIFMIYRFKLRNKKVQQLGVDKENKKETKRKKNEKALFYLALFQCIATTLPGFLMTAWDVTNYFDPTFVFCGGNMLSPMTDLVIQVVNTIDVYFMLCVSDIFRQMVKSILPRRNAEQKTNGPGKDLPGGSAMAPTHRASIASAVKLG